MTNTNKTGAWRNPAGFKDAEICVPLVPAPAPAEISPVGFSSTLIIISFFNLSSESSTSKLTLLNIFLYFKSLIELFRRISLNGSPSSISNVFLITFSCVE